MTFTIAELLKDSAYKLGQFKPEQISALEVGHHDQGLEQETLRPTSPAWCAASRSSSRRKKPSASFT